MADGIIDRISSAIGGPCRQGKTIALIVLVLAVSFIAAGAVVREDLKDSDNGLRREIASIDKEQARVSERLEVTNELLRRLLRRLSDGD